MPRHVVLRTSLALLILVVSRPVPGLACCNVIPMPGTTFQSVTGFTNRPFSSPGESVQIGLRSCDGTSFPNDPVVTVLVRRTTGTDVVVTAASCTGLSGALAAC